MPEAILAILRIVSRAGSTIQQTGSVIIEITGTATIALPQRSAADNHESPQVISPC
jgi:hypothetical protein